MNSLSRLLYLWGVVDSAWLIMAPESWSKFWLPKIKKMTSSDQNAKWLGVSRLLLCLLLFSNKPQKRKKFLFF